MVLCSFLRGFIVPFTFLLRCLSKGGSNVGSGLNKVSLSSSSCLRLLRTKPSSLKLSRSQNGSFWSHQMLSVKVNDQLRRPYVTVIDFMSCPLRLVVCHATEMFIFNFDSNVLKRCLTIFCGIFSLF